MDAKSVAAALAGLRQDVRWRSQGDPQRLRARVLVLIRLGHLPLGATQTTCEAIVAAIVADADADAYACRTPDGQRLALLSRITGRPWIIVCDLDGVVETAFPSADPAGYLAGLQGTRLGTVRALLGAP